MLVEKGRKYLCIIYFIKLLGSPWSVRYFKSVLQGRIGFSGYSNCLPVYRIDQTIQKGISKPIPLLSSQDLQQLTNGYRSSLLIGKMAQPSPDYK